ncbi:MAG: tRNA (adenosine(37)-N6)-threonylcarbamoyltransferase complex transferase subunit TsaD [Cryomorphaceae bacterium]|nr:tRNA (adenosine(37)-N6)-threonylcarbamoyltransferase complex transferase subunit TsaD [Cryomorphaceae bacterium]
MNNPLILGIESSCDDTSAAVLKGTQILANITHTQLIHEQYGGVVPELASRAHIEHIVPVVKRALDTAQISVNEIDAIAFTQGPGLMGSLVVGTSFAKGLALALNKPLIGVHHMKAHILSHFITHEGMTAPSFPFLCLTVSGGHTQIVVVHDALNMEIIGKTIDDAAGEAFDKAAKMLGLPYPGGPLIDQYAQAGDPNVYAFAEPNIPALNFSFSGLKTSILYFLKKEVAKDSDFVASNLNNLCASIQHSITEILVKKLKKAQQQTGITCIAVSGGVSVNRGLRAKLHAWQREQPQLSIHLAHPSFCTDNAAMIAIAGSFLLEAGITHDQKIAANAKLPW